MSLLEFPADNTEEYNKLLRTCYFIKHDEFEVAGSDDSEGSGDLIRAKSVSLPKVPSNEDVLTQPKAVKAAVMNRLLPDYKSEL